MQEAFTLSVLTERIECFQVEGKASLTSTLFFSTKYFSNQPLKVSMWYLNLIAIVYCTVFLVPQRQKAYLCLVGTSK